MHIIIRPKFDLIKANVGHNFKYPTQYQRKLEQPYRKFATRRSIESE